MAPGLYLFGLDRNMQGEPSYRDLSFAIERLAVRLGGAAA